MKIGIDGRFWNSKNTGLSQYTKGVIKALSRLDKKNEYMVFLKEEDYTEWDIDAENFKIAITNLKHFSFGEQLFLPRKLFSHKLDLMYFPNFNYPIFYPGKFVTTIHDLAYFYFQPSKLKSKIFKWGYYGVLWSGIKRASNIFVDTLTVKEEVMRKLGVDSEKIKVVTLGVDFTRLKRDKRKAIQLKQKMGIEGEIILYVGEWRSHKNIPALLSAFSQIAQTRSKVHLILGGRPNQEVLDLIYQHPYKNKIFAPGFIPEKELATYYQLADVFVLPSLYEGFGLPIIEAQYLGIPVAVSNIPTLQEVGGESVFYFDPLDSNDIALKILQILEDKKTQLKLIKKGKINTNKFSWDKAAIDLCEIFERIKN